MNVERPSWYNVEGPMETEKEAVQAMCETLEMVGQSGGPSEKDLATWLNLSGLQKDRTQLLLTQRGQLVKLTSLQKQNSVPMEDLVDIHWKLGVVAGSSEEGEAGRTFVQVNFICQAPGGSKRSAKLVEMSLEKFYDFLHQLEKCKASLEHNHLL
uniref:COMM domain-containing protein n=1 Tax=Scylla olivacea TaxID=85551 RepID=A0A0P4WNS6_SCYOL